MREKNWPAATKHSVEKIEKAVKDLRKTTDNLTKWSKGFDLRLDTMQAAASASALVEAVKDVAAAIREGGGGGDAELRQQVADALDKITALTNANTAALKGGTDGETKT